MRLVHAALFFCRSSCRLQKLAMVIWKMEKAGLSLSLNILPVFCLLFSTLCSLCMYQYKMMMMIIIMTSLGLVWHSYCCSCLLTHSIIIISVCL